MSEKVVTGTGWDISAKVPWTIDTIKVRLLPGGGIEVRWTEQNTGDSPK